jgi:hypothetical protein
MSDKKHAEETRRAFRSSDKKAPLTEHEEKQRAVVKNLERLKAERLAREAAKSKDKWLVGSPRRRKWESDEGSGSSW